MKSITEMSLKEFFMSDQYVVVDSDLLGEKVVWASNDVVALRAKPENLIAFTAKELKQIVMSGLAGEELKEAYRIKKAFGGKIVADGKAER